MSTEAARNPEMVLAESLAAKAREAHEAAKKREAFLQAGIKAIRTVFALAMDGNQVCKLAAAEITKDLGIQDKE